MCVFETIQNSCPNNVCFLLMPECRGLLGLACHLEVCKSNHRGRRPGFLKRINFQSLNSHMFKMDLLEDIFMMRTQVLTPSVCPLCKRNPASLPSHCDTLTWVLKPLGTKQWDNLEYWFW